MADSGKAANKIIFGVLYAAIIVFTVWGGFRVVDYALMSGFYKDYLMKWEASVREYGLSRGAWPAFDEKRPIEFMDTLVGYMRRKGVPLPRSNTKRPHVYRIKRMGSPHEDVFVLCLPDRIVLYGVSKRTCTRLDDMIDGRGDAGRGWFTWQPSADGAYVGVWRI